MRKVVYIVILLFLILAACSVSRKADKYGNKSVISDIVENSVASVVHNNLSRSNFYIQKADINVIQNNASARFTASIKYRKPDTMLVTIRSKTGIEAGRALITKDTILINDRINRKILVGSPSVLGEKYGIEPELLFVVIGDIIVEEKDKGKLMNCVKGFYNDRVEINGKSLSYLIDCDRKKVSKAIFEGDFKSGDINMSFDDFRRFRGLIYPGKIELNDELNSVKISVEIRKIESPWYGRITFVSGSGFKVIKIR